MIGRVQQAGIAQAVLGYAITGLGACLVLLADDLGVAPEQLGWLPATFGFGLLALALTGPLLLRGGPRPALIGGSLVVALGVTLLALAPNTPAAVTGALLLGAGGAAFVLVTPALLSGSEAAIQLTKVNALSSIASVLAPAAIGGLDATGLVGGRLALLIAVPPLLYLAATTARSRSAQPGPAPTDGPPSAHGRPAPGLVARRWAGVVLAVSVEFCFTIWAVARLAEAGLALATAAVVGTAFPIGMALGRLAGPALIRRIPVVPVGAAVTAAGAVLVAAAGHPAAVTAGLVVAGAGVATLYPVALAGLVATPRLSAAHAASLGALASGTAILAAPAALARLADVVDLRLAFLITLPLLALLLLIRRR
ncbi:MFS transporter [Actinoplanes friuliensis]|uniref:Fucose permease n=1 Tax=Actinoplanes friuliensis DSM 7358 TaxID=1246995 RepID=U5W5V5_9ACTN|nr:MFS transporter [Actinoplanes friuliensis]AGZ44548.1 hypothetical protein AFR_31440 [Actinoplanes friuliensis DSM 7358]